LGLAVAGNTSQAGKGFRCVLLATPTFGLPSAYLRPTFGLPSAVVLARRCCMPSAPVLHAFGTGLACLRHRCWQGGVACLRHRHLPSLAGQGSLQGKGFRCVSLPWFRVHGVVLNDPGRLLSVHCAHTALTSGWAGLMLFFEAIVTDDSDLIFSPLWRQGLFVTAFCTRLGLVPMDPGITSHTTLCGLMHLASIWHWVFWDLDIFTTGRTLALDLLRVFGIHLVLASTPCFFFGHTHLTASIGPGFWTTAVSYTHPDAADDHLAV
jgi:hypothetical protein